MRPPICAICDKDLTKAADILGLSYKYVLDQHLEGHRRTIIGSFLNICRTEQDKLPPKTKELFNEIIKYKEELNIEI